jgi:hypothetical protein
MPTWIFLVISRIQGSSLRSNKSLTGNDPWISREKTIAFGRLQWNHSRDSCRFTYAPDTIRGGTRSICKAGQMERHLRWTGPAERNVRRHQVVLTKLVKLPSYDVSLLAKDYRGSSQDFNSVVSGGLISSTYRRGAERPWKNGFQEYSWWFQFRACSFLGFTGSCDQGQRYRNLQCLIPRLLHHRDG